MAAPPERRILLHARRAYPPPPPPLTQQHHETLNLSALIIAVAVFAFACFGAWRYGKARARQPLPALYPAIARIPDLDDEEEQASLRHAASLRFGSGGTGRRSPKKKAGGPKMNKTQFVKLSGGLLDKYKSGTLDPDTCLQRIEKLLERYQ